MPKTLEDRFHDAMLEINREAEKTTKHNFKTFKRMLAEYGGVETAKRLVKDSKPSDGYIELVVAKKWELTSEALMVKKEWKELFTPQEIEMAKKKLREFGYIISD